MPVGSTRKGCGCEEGEEEEEEEEEEEAGRWASRRGRRRRVDWKAAIGGRPQDRHSTRRRTPCCWRGILMIVLFWLLRWVGAWDDGDPAQASKAATMNAPSCGDEVIGGRTEGYEEGLVKEQLEGGRGAIDDTEHRAALQTKGHEGRGSKPSCRCRPRRRNATGLRDC